MAISCCHNNNFYFFSDRPCHKTFVTTPFFFLLTLWKSENVFVYMAPAAAAAAHFLCFETIRSAASNSANFFFLYRSDDIFIFHQLSPKSISSGRKISIVHCRDGCFLKILKGNSSFLPLILFNMIRIFPPSSPQEDDWLLIMSTRRVVGYFSIRSLWFILTTARSRRHIFASLLEKVVLSCAWEKVPHDMSYLHNIRHHKEPRDD